MKEQIFNTAKAFILVTALGQLALSQVHIGIITKVFTPSVGFILFLFIISGLVMAFNTTSVARGSRIFLFIAGCIAASLTGGMYLNILIKEINTGTLLTFEDAKLSIFYSSATILVYIAGTISMLVTRNFDE